MKRLIVLAAMAAALVPAMRPPAAEAGTRYCLPRSGNHRVCVTTFRTYKRVCFTLYLRSGGKITRCHRRSL
jgi:hypothetical protein